MFSAILSPRLSGQAARSAASGAPRAAASAPESSSQSSPRARSGAARPRSGTASRSTRTGRDAPRPRISPQRSARGRETAAAPPRTWRTDPSCALSHGRLGKRLLQKAPPPMEAGHHRADRNVQDLRRVLVAEVPDVHENDHVTEIVWDGGECPYDRVLGKALHDLVHVLRGAVLLEPVVEVVVAFLDRLRVRGALLAATPIDVQIREDPEEPGPQVRPGPEGAPAPEGARVGVLNEILGLLP